MTSIVIMALICLLILYPLFTLLLGVYLICKYSGWTRRQKVVGIVFWIISVVVFLRQTVLFLGSLISVL